MHDYLLSSEWVRFAFVLGIAVSMVMYEKRHLTTGSIVVPGYVAVFMVHPLVLVATFVNALLTYAAVNLVLRRFILLYGRTKFTMLAHVSAGIQILMLRLSPSGPWLWESDVPLVIGVGYIVPALIAHDMARQGIRKTTVSVLTAGLVVAVPIALAILLELPGVNELAPVDGFGSTLIEVGWLPIAVVLSIGASWAVAMNFGWRSGGFVGAAFTGMFMADPWQIVAAVSVAAVTWVVVKVLMRHMILFGRRKFSAMLLVSSMLAWSGLWVGDRFLDASWHGHLGVGSLALTPLLLPGLLANDAQRTSPARVAAGVVLASSFVVTTTWSLQSVFTDAWLHPGWTAMSAVTGVVLFNKQLVQLARWARRRARALVDMAVALGGRLPRPGLPARRGFLTGLGRRTVSGLGATPQAVFATAGTGEPFDIPASWTTSWSSWADSHPDVARDAERWLDDVLTEPAARRSATRRDGAFDPFVDETSAAVLEEALAASRGLRHVPRRPDSDPPRPLPSGADEISGTSGATSREAQLVAPDVLATPEGGR